MVRLYYTIEHGNKGDVKMENITIDEKKAIKKSFDRLKKKLFADNDPFKLKGSMYMTNQQMEKRTATINLGGASTPEYEAALREKGEKLVNTEAFQAFADEVGLKSVSYELKEDAYYRLCLYMRLNY